MRKADHTRHRYDISTEKRQLHTHLTLRHPIAHRWNCPCNLCNGIVRLCVFTYFLWILFVGFVCRQHVVVGCYNSNVWHDILRQFRLVIVTTSRVGMCEVSALQARTRRNRSKLLMHGIEVLLTRFLAAFNDSLGDI